MYIEDLVIALATSKNVGMNPYDSKLIYSFFDQLTRNSGFTEKQELLSVRILKRQAQKLYLIFLNIFDPQSLFLFSLVDNLKV